MTPTASKFVWLIFNPASLFTALLIVGALLLFVGRWRRVGRNLVATAAIAAAVIAYSPVSDWLLEPLEARFASPPAFPNSVAGIIVLGGAIDTQQSRRYSQVALNGRSDRITTFVELAHRFPQAKLVYSGGAGDPMDEATSEAASAKPLLTALGIPEARLMLEMRSRDTYENARLSYELVKPGSGDVWIVVTSAVHMPRAIGAFRRSGWTVIGYSVDHRRYGRSEDTFGYDLIRGLSLLNIALHEWVGLAHYYMTDRSNRIFPAP